MAHGLKDERRENKNLKKDFPSVMLRDIHDEPRVLRESIAGNEREVERIAREISCRRYSSFFIIGCTTSLFGGMVGKYAMEEYAGIPVRALPASEMASYPPPDLSERSLVIPFSRSGETGDILEAVAVAKSRKAGVLAVTNTLSSSLAKEATYSVPLMVSEEGLVMTKSVGAEMAVGLLLALKMVTVEDKLPKARVEELLSQLRAIPDQAERLIMDVEPRVAALAEEVSSSEHLFIIGNGPNYATALEGMLKMKEAALIHAEACQGNEFRHGHINIIKRGTPVVALAPEGRSYPKMLRILKDCREAEARVIVEGRGTELRELSRNFMEIAFHVDEPLTPLLYLVPLQLLAYYSGVSKELDVDHPPGSERVGAYQKVGGRLVYHIRKT